MATNKTVLQTGKAKVNVQERAESIVRPKHPQQNASELVRRLNNGADSVEDKKDQLLAALKKGSKVRSSTGKTKEGSLIDGAEDVGTHATDEKRKLRRKQR